MLKDVVVEPLEILAFYASPAQVSYIQYTSIFLVREGHRKSPSQIFGAS